MSALRSRLKPYCPRHSVRLEYLHPRQYKPLAWAPLLLLLRLWRSGVTTPRKGTSRSRRTDAGISHALVRDSCRGRGEHVCDWQCTRTQASRSQTRCLRPRLPWSTTPEHVRKLHNRNGAWDPCTSRYRMAALASRGSWCGRGCAPAAPGRSTLDRHAASCLRK